MEMKFTDVVKMVKDSVKEDNLSWEADRRRYNTHKINFYSEVTGALVAVYNRRTGAIEVIK